MKKIISTLAVSSFSMSYAINTSICGTDTEISKQKFNPGQKQRLNSLLATIHKQELLVLDEPTNGLDLFVQNYYFLFN